MVLNLCKLSTLKFLVWLRGVKAASRPMLLLTAFNTSGWGTRIFLSFLVLCLSSSDDSDGILSLSRLSLVSPDSLQWSLSQWSNKQLTSLYRSLSFGRSLSSCHQDVSSSHRGACHIVQSAWTSRSCLLSIDVKNKDCLLTRMVFFSESCL